MQFFWYIMLDKDVDIIVKIFVEYMKEKGIAIYSIEEDDNYYVAILCEWFVAWIGSKEPLQKGYDFVYEEFTTEVNFEIYIQLYPNCDGIIFSDFVRYFLEHYDGDTHLEDEYDHTYLNRRKGVIEVFDVNWKNVFNIV